jgi:hypothetical protein
MSRTEIENDNWMIAIGVDHATGPFMQVWKQPHGEQDGCFLRMDWNGVSLDKDIEGFEVPKPALREIGKLAMRFDAAFQQGNRQPNIHPEDILGLAKHFGFNTEEITRQVFAALD